MISLLVLEFNYLVFKLLNNLIFLFQFIRQYCNKFSIMNG